MMSDIFSSGHIYLIQTTVNGNCGIPSLYGRLLNGSFGVEILDDTGEIYALFTTANHKTLLILHVDDYGVDLTKRRLFKGKFRTMLSDTQQPLTLTREQLKRLVLDGTYTLEWQNSNLQAQMAAFRQAEPMPVAKS